MGNRGSTGQHQARRQRRPKRKANTSGSALGPVCKLALGEGRRGVDSYDVREWFVTDPSTCVSDIAAQKILREYEHPSKLWITFPAQDKEDQISRFEKAVRVAVEQRAARGRRGTRASIEKKVRESAEKGIQKEMVGLVQRAGEALVADQFTPWWQSLRNHLSVNLPAEVVDRFTDYLSGYCLVLENETPRRSATWEDRSKKVDDNWRQLKKLLRKLNGGVGDVESMLPASATPPQQEGLKTKLIRVMSEDLVALGYSRKIVADKFLPVVWDAVCDRILGRSFLRIERRSRQRTTHRK
jgi:hypothetical protein